MMGRYREIKEIYKDITKDKIMVILLRVFMIVLIGFALIIVYKAMFEPVNILGIELNKNKVKHDTLKLIIRDTVVQTVYQANSSSKPIQDVKANVKSYNQKGGQTANQINNTH